MARKNHRSPEEARDAILDAAEKVVVNVGPAGLRISAVAKVAGMAHPNIIHHFGSREGLLNALAERVGAQATQRITQAIALALESDEQDRVAAVTRILDSAYEGDQGKVAVWMHLSGAESSMRENMLRIVEATHQLRTSIDGEAKYSNTNRLVMLTTLALVGEVVSGAGIKDALGYQTQGEQRANFRQWLAELILNLSDEELNTSLDT